MDYKDWENDWLSLNEKECKYGYEKLTPDERIWINTRSLIDAVGNGGLISFYYNHGADYLQETLEDLKKLEAYNVIDLVHQVNSLFPNSKPSRDIDERNQIINSWIDVNSYLDNFFDSINDKFYALEDELEAKLEPIIKRVISKSVY